MNDKSGGSESKYQRDAQISTNKINDIDFGDF
jgi:hypothetical protein